MARKENPTLTKLPIGSIRPEGWLLKEIQLVNGLQKRLGAISGLTENGAWVQGEALPRYIRGLVLLYGAMGDKMLLDKAQSFLSSILNGAKEGGDFGPQDKIFGTAKIEGLKAVYSYYELTGDETAFQVLRKFFKNLCRIFPLKNATRANGFAINSSFLFRIATAWLPWLSPIPPLVWISKKYNACKVILPTRF